MYSNFSQYGEALKELFKSVFNGNVILEPADTAFQYAIKNTDNKLTFPFISFYPDNTVYLDRKNISMPSYREGLRFKEALTTYNDDCSLKGTNERLAKNVKYLYIIIGYQIDVWATTRLEAEQTMQELVFWLYENQEVEIDYQGNKLGFSFDLASEITDNSDLVSYQSNGKMYRYTFGIQVHATLLRSENYFTVIKPSVKVEKLKKGGN